MSITFANNSDIFVPLHCFRIAGNLRKTRERKSDGVHVVSCAAGVLVLVDFFAPALFLKWFDFLFAIMPILVTRNHVTT